MVFSVILLLAGLIQLCLAFHGKDLYYQAQSILQNISSNIDYQPTTIYNDDNIYGKFYVPQYDMDLDDYVNTKVNHCPDIITNTVIPLLEESANNHYYEAYIQLGDFYTFGYYSLKPDYLKAKQYYEKAVEISSNGHSYFMLGFMYSSGLFGLLPVDQARATLYYQAGMENGDIDSMIALAYRNAHGIGTPTNCELALVYYSRLAQIAIEHYEKIDNPNEVDDSEYNIKIVDFNGGIYGEKLSESVKSIMSRTKFYAKSAMEFEEFNIDGNNHDFVNNYINGLKYYDGDYFLPKNYTKSAQFFEKCVNIGHETYGQTNYKHVDRLDAFYLSRCQAQLGRLYLRGLGVEKDIVKANLLLTRSLLVNQIGDALNDLGYIEERELLPGRNSSSEDKPIVKASELYKKAIAKGSTDARLNLAKLLTSISPDHEPMRGEYAGDIYTNVRKAVYNGHRESLYYLAEYLQSGLASKVDTKNSHECPNMNFYLKMFVDRSESYFFPHLKFAFDELIKGNYKNSLIGYSIAAEQGLENAQISAAYLLYQTQPLWSLNGYKTFDAKRVEASIKYLEKASKQKNLDATILLGDLYMNGIDNEILEKDYAKSFSYFKKAANDHSPHGAYKLGYMYEYGLGPSDSMIDYFMAKRYYDLSIQYQIQFNKVLNKSAVNWALLRLRMKYLFNKKKFKSNSESEQMGWLNAFNKLRGGNKDSENNRANEKATAHHEGTTLTDEDYEDFDILDYVVVILTFSFFLMFFIQNIIRRLRRMDNEENGNQRQAENNQPRDGVEMQNGWNGAQFNFRRGNFEFHFFAL
ncbi:putative hmg-CoA reductase degradation protein [Scheffersomyces amazonensis]|uniref:putative hmg-CoA reductase degradation protein n=1 Tax=Scheffersomyces amazonensis TaxID=1078765 RepID=UPI00315C8E7C